MVWSQQKLPKRSVIPGGYGSRYVKYFKISQPSLAVFICGRPRFSMSSWYIDTPHIYVDQYRYTELYWCVYTDIARWGPLVISLSIDPIEYSCISHKTIVSLCISQLSYLGGLTLYTYILHIYHIYIFIYVCMGLSENMASLNPWVNHHFSLLKCLFGYIPNFQINP
jgi:hypothetical protein